MDPHKLLEHAQSLKPVDLIRFVRSGQADAMGVVEVYALVLALTTQLEAAIEANETASLVMDFQRKIDPDTAASLTTEYAQRLEAEDAELASRSFDQRYAEHYTNGPARCAVCGKLIEPKRIDGKLSLVCSCGSALLGGPSDAELAERAQEWSGL